jgi:hypothetical protein
MFFPISVLRAGWATAEHHLAIKAMEFPQASIETALPQRLWIRRSINGDFP